MHISCVCLCIPLLCIHDACLFNVFYSRLSRRWLVQGCGEGRADTTRTKVCGHLNAKPIYNLLRWWPAISLETFNKRMKSGPCACWSSSSTPTIFPPIDLALCLRALSCWNRRGHSPNCSYSVRRTILFQTVILHPEERMNLRGCVRITWAGEEENLNSTCCRSVLLQKCFTCCNSITALTS